MSLGRKITTKKWLAGGRRGIALVGLLTLAYLVIFFCWLARIKLPNAPAAKLPHLLLVMLRHWLVGARWRILPAGALLLAVMAASAGGTYGGGLTITASTNSLEVSPGSSATYTLGWEGNPLSLNGVECGDFLLVHIFGGAYLNYLEFDHTNHGIELIDENDDGDCDDEGEVRWDDFWGNSVTVSVAADAPGNAIIGISYVVKKNHRRVVSPNSVMRIRVSGVVPPTPIPTPRPPVPPQQSDPPPQETDNPPQQPENANTPQNTGGNVPGTAPSPGGSSGGGGGSSGSGGGGGSGSGSRSALACAPRPPADSAIRNLVGSTAAATAWEVANDRLWLERKDLPNTTIELGIGWFAHDASSQVIIGLVGSNANGAMGIIRDQILGQTYTIVRHEGDDCVVRRWVAPYDHLVYQIPWATVNSLYSVPVEVVSAIPLDHRHPEPNMLVRRFDGSDVRIFAFDASLQQWRHIPDYPTFQAMGFYWCDVTSADATFFERMNEGPPYPSSGTELQKDYPNCHNKKP